MLLQRLQESIAGRFGDPVHVWNGEDHVWTGGGGVLPAWYVQYLGMHGGLRLEDSGWRA
jgi:hypothetical protein